MFVTMIVLSPPEMCDFRMGGLDIPVFGSMLDPRGDCEEDLRCRIGLGWLARIPQELPPRQVYTRRSY